MKGNAPPFIDSKNKARPSRRCSAEIAAGKVHFNRASHGAVVEYIAMVNKREFGT